MILWAFAKSSILANAYFIFIEPKQSDVLKLELSCFISSSVNIEPKQSDVLKLVIEGYEGLTFSIEPKQSDVLKLSNSVFVFNG